MIRIVCDVCGEEIAEYRERKRGQEGDGGLRKGDPLQSWHKCAKCAELLRMVDLPSLLKKAIVEMREDIPKDEKGADRQRSVKFVP